MTTATPATPSRRTPSAPGWGDGVAVVTGAASGLGLEVSRRLAGAGCRLVLVDVSGAVHDTAAGLRARGASATAVQGDVSQEATATRAGAAADALGSGVTRVFLGAGIDPLAARSVVETSVELWDAVIAVNLRSAFLFAREMLPRMTATGGSLVVTGSSAAHQGAPDEAAYTVSKTALLGLVRSVSRDFGRHGVRATCLSPGPMEAVMGDRRADLSAAELLARRAAVEASVPLGREGSYAEVAAAALFLLGPDSAYVSGTSLLVDGGLVG